MKYYKYLILVLYICISSNLHCQIGFDFEPGVRHPVNKISQFSIDSIFEKYTIPIFPEFKDSDGIKDGFSIYFFCYIKVDKKNLKCQTLKVYPLKGLGNNIPDSSKVWDLMTEAIITSSEGWIFKPFIYNTKNIKNAELLRYLLDANSAKYGYGDRPYGGSQEHMILMKYCVGYCNVLKPNLLYMMEIGEQKVPCELDIYFDE